MFKTDREAREAELRSTTEGDALLEARGFQLENLPVEAEQNHG